MLPRTLTRVTAPILVLTLLAPLGAPATTAEESGAGEVTGGWRIEARPRRVYCRTLVTLVLVGPDGPERAATTTSTPPRIRWTADRGRMFYDDLPAIHWRAPRTPGACELAVTAWLPASEPGATPRTVTARLRVEALAPSTEGMIRIPAGTFLCGDEYGTRSKSEAKTVQNNNDEPFHEVYLKEYWIDRFPVTNRQYADYLESAIRQGFARVEEIAVMGEFEGSWVPFYYFQPYERMVLDYYETRNARVPLFEFDLSWDGERMRVAEGKDRYPIVDVSWFGAAAYAEFHGKRLPSEAQWEKAARGTDGRRYPWGENLPTAYHVNLEQRFTPVGTYSPLGDSPYGLADILSPAFEWTNDWFNVEYYRDFWAEGPHRNPRGTFWGSSHSIRGPRNDILALTPSVQRLQPLTRRYNWHFEFLIGDAFASNETTFRCVIEDSRTSFSQTPSATPKPLPATTSRTSP